MSERLTSVRFDLEVLDRLKTVSQIHDTSVAEEVRAAVDRYLEAVASDDAFQAQIDAANEDRDRRIRELMSAASAES